MKIEIRNGMATISGYVNAVERFSRPLADQQGRFIEKIASGAFERSLKAGQEVVALLNHDWGDIVAKTSDNSLELREDNIGLHATLQTSNPTIIEKGEKGLLRGWSFGFINIDEKRDETKVPVERTVNELELREVSIIDNRQRPCYIGTMIEVRGEETNIIEYRQVDEKPEIIIEEKEEKEEISDLHLYKNRVNRLRSK